MRTFGLQGLALGAVLGFAAGVAAAWWHYSPRLKVAEQRAEHLVDLVREQNRAVEALKTATDNRIAAARAAAERARGEAEAHRKAADRILSQRLPAGLDACTASCMLIDAEVRP